MCEIDFAKKDTIILIIRVHETATFNQLVHSGKNGDERIRMCPNNTPTLLSPIPLDELRVFYPHSIFTFTFIFYNTLSRSI